MPTADDHTRLADPSQASAELGDRARAQQLEAEFSELYDDPATVAWQARSTAGAIAPPSSPSSPRRSVRDRIAAMGAAAQARTETAAADVCTPAAVELPGGNSYVDAPPPSSAPSSPSSPRLSREAWHKAELARLQLARRVERQQAKKLATRLRDEANAEHAREADATEPTSGVWSAGRVDQLLRARAKTRARTMEARPAAVRQTWEKLCADPATAHFAIGIKRACARRGWTLADVAAQRALAILEFLRELATPHCWNAQHVRAPQRRGSRRNAKPTAGAETFATLTLRKYTPAVRGVSQTFLASVAAGAGHAAADDRRCSTKTVQRAIALLVSVGLVQAVQVPAHAAEPFELGDSGHSINRYYLADRGSPKPALMACWLVRVDADGSATLLPAHAEALALPWLGAQRPEAPS